MNIRVNKERVLNYAVIYSQNNQMQSSWRCFCESENFSESNLALISFKLKEAIK